MASNTSSTDKKMPRRLSSLRRYLGLSEAGNYLGCTQVTDRGSQVDVETNIVSEGVVPDPTKERVLCSDLGPLLSTRAT